MNPPTKGNEAQMPVPPKSSQFAEYLREKHGIKAEYFSDGKLWHYVTWEDVDEYVEYIKVQVRIGKL